VAARRARRTDQSTAKPAPRKRAAKRPARSRRSAILLRWCILGAAGLVAFLYYQPVSSYLETRAALRERTTEVRVLQADKARLEKRLADSSTVQALSREARLMGLVREGERLFIVKGIKEWRRSQAASIGRDG
jgi:hypothetical protein